MFYAFLFHAMFRVYASLFYATLDRAIRSLVLYIYVDAFCFMSRVWVVLHSHIVPWCATLLALSLIGCPREHVQPRISSLLWVFRGEKLYPWMDNPQAGPATDARLWFLLNAEALTSALLWGCFPRLRLWVMSMSQSTTTCNKHDSFWGEAAPLLIIIKQIYNELYDWFKVHHKIGTKLASNT